MKLFRQCGIFCFYFINKIRKHQILQQLQLKNQLMFPTILALHVFLPQRTASLMYWLACSPREGRSFVLFLLAIVLSVLLRLRILITLLVSSNHSYWLCLSRIKLIAQYKKKELHSLRGNLGSSTVLFVGPTLLILLSVLTFLFGFFKCHVPRVSCDSGHS